MAKQFLNAIVAVGAVALVVSACGSSSTTSSGSASSTSTVLSTGGSAAPPVTSGSPYHVGFITSLTGPVAPDLAISLKAAQARIDLQNAEGGVNGHKIVLDSGDDGGSTTQVVTAAQNLVENDHDLVVGTTSYFTAAISGYLHSVGEPVVGANYDGPEWGTQPNTNMFGNWGPMNPHYPATTTYAEEFKQLGATKLACVANNVPGGIGSCKISQIGGNAVGISTVYTNDSLSLAQSSFSDVVLGIKSSGANGIFLSLAASQAVPIMVALSQAGVHVPALILTTGYGQDLLTSPTDVQAGQGAIFNSYFTPVELKTAGTSAFQAALQKYAGISATSVPNFEAYEGWVTADQLVKALQSGGVNPSKSSIIAGMQQVSGYTEGGLASGPISYSLSKFGTGGNPLGADNCDYFLKLSGTKFVPTSTSPVCGTIVPNSNTA